MFKRACLAVVAALLLLPTVAIAQFRDPAPKPRFSLTPIVGYRLPYEATGEMALHFRNGSTSFLESREQRGGGMMMGAEAELRLFGPLGLVASFVHAESAENQVEQFIHADGLEMNWAGPTRSPTVQFLKAGLVVFLPERSPELQRMPIAASLSVGPAVVREVQLPDAVPPDFPQASPVSWDPVNHYAVAVGARVVLPLTSRLVALRFGADDYITFWNVRELNRQTVERFGGAADWSYGRYHLFVAHAGLSLRF
jgi:hypothetical protein